MCALAAVLMSRALSSFSCLDWGCGSMVWAKGFFQLQQVGQAAFVDKDLLTMCVMLLLIWEVGADRKQRGPGSKSQLEDEWLQMSTLNH